MRVLSQSCLLNKTVPLLIFAALVALPASAARHSHHHNNHHHSGGSTATYYSRGDSNPHLANGDYYGRSGPWFCAVDSSHRALLNHRIQVVNKRNGRSHVFLVSDLGRFSRGNVDISRGGSSRLSGRGEPDNFPVEWHDLGLASGHSKHKRHHKAKHR